MRIPDIIKEVPSLFNWYSDLTRIKKLQFNYISLLLLSFTYNYFSIREQRDINSKLYERIDHINSAREKEQDDYIASLQFFTREYRELLERFVENQFAKENNDKTDKK